MVRRYELPNYAWSLLKELLSPPKKRGRPRNDDRLMLNGVFWVLCSGATWRDLPERFGAWSTVYQRYRDWRDDGTLEQALDRLQTLADEAGMINMDTWQFDPMRIKERLADY